jgi:hypothetical protein
MTPAPGTPDFTGWSRDRLTAQKTHLESLLAVSAGQDDPVRPQLRAVDREDMLAKRVQDLLDIIDQVAPKAEG